MSKQTQVGDMTYIITEKWLEEFGDYVEDDENHTEEKYKNARGLTGKIRSNPYNPQAEREKVLNYLDIELQEVKSRIESSAMGQPLSERSRGEIIGLLHAREKIKYLRQEDKDGE